MKRSLFALALAAALLPVASHADEIKRGFYLDPMNYGTQGDGDFSSVWMHGYFEGNDANGDGILSLNELQVLTTFTSYTVFWDSGTVRNDFAPAYSYSGSGGDYAAQTYSFSYDSHAESLSFNARQVFHQALYSMGIGSYIRISDNVAFDWKPGATLTVVPVPEPASLGLLGLGLAGVAVQRRRRATSAARREGTSAGQA